MPYQERALEAALRLPDLEDANNGIRLSGVRNISHDGLPDSAQYRYLVALEGNPEGVPPGVYIETNLTPGFLYKHHHAPEALGARVTTELFSFNGKKTTEDVGIILNSADFVSATGAEIFHLTLRG